MRCACKVSAIDIDPLKTTPRECHRQCVFGSVSTEAPMEATSGPQFRSPIASQMAPSAPYEAGRAAIRARKPRPIIFIGIVHDDLGDGPELLLGRRFVHWLRVCHGARLRFATDHRLKPGGGPLGSGAGNIGSSGCSAVRSDEFAFTRDEGLSSANSAGACWCDHVAISALERQP
jgi:hypothetical protein